MTDYRPDNLKSYETDLENNAVTIPPKPVPVRAFVRYAGTSFELDAEAVKWTSRAVALQWDTPNGQHQTWVWAGAVSDR